MPHIFVYGTLCWPDLLARVAGQDSLTVAPATLKDHRVTWVDGHAFPMIQAEPGAVASGHLIYDCTAQVVDRLDFYEGGFDYTLRPHQVDTDRGATDALVYMPPEHLRPGADWNLTDWMDRHGAIAFEAASEVMLRMGHDTPHQVAAKYGMMQVRAAQRLAAADEPSTASPSGLAAGDVTTADYRLPYANFFAIGEADVTVPRFGGGAYGPVTRAAFLGTDAAIVLPYDPVRDRVMLVEQFRPGPFLRSDPHPWMMEPIAGRVDVGEDANVTATREAMEEAGITLTALHQVHQGYPSPGCSTEFFHIYVGIADLPDDVARIGGLETEAEDIMGHLVDWATFDKRLNTGGYPVIPLALAGHWLARNRDTLRSAT